MKVEIGLGGARLPRPSKTSPYRLREYVKPFLRNPFPPRNLLPNILISIQVGIIKKIMKSGTMSRLTKRAYLRKLRQCPEK